MKKNCKIKRKKIVVEIIILKYLLNKGKLLIIKEVNKFNILLIIEMNDFIIMLMLLN